MQTLKSLLLFLLFFCSLNIFAQEVCEGTLDNPVLNIDFGSGNSVYGPALENGTGNYNFVTGNLMGPYDGDYTIAKGTFGMFDYVGGWHQIPNHTPNDSDGYMMIVSADATPGDFFQTTIKNLSPNTKYEIASWLIRLPNYITNNPNITITIETTAGVLLAPEINTGDIENSIEPTWNRYQGIFSTGNETEVVLRMRSNNPGGDGNDFGLDDITVTPYLPIIIPSINNSLPTAEACENSSENFTLDAYKCGYDHPQFQWQSNNGNGWKNINGETKRSLVVSTGNFTKGIYQYRLIVAELGNLDLPDYRIISSLLTINITGADAGADQTILAGTSTMLNGIGNGIKHKWTPILYLDDPTKLNPIATPPKDIIYTLQETSNSGCISTDEVLITVKPNIVIPNTFTPNGDGINDTWNIPTTESFSSIVVRITNRYGQLVYQSIGKYKPWDGKFSGNDLPSAVYYYTLNLNNGLSIYSGWVMIIR